MENSRAYKYLIEQVDATGSRKMDGYYPKIMEEIYDWERNEVEDIIWETFHKNNDYDLAMFFPKLKNYNGIEELKNTLEKCRIPSENSVNIAKVLYENTYDNFYIEIIKKNIEKAPNNGTFVAMISYAKPSEELYNLLVEIYINCNDKIIRGSATRGILYNKGFINNPYDFKEIIQKTSLRKMFFKDTQVERKEIISNLESGVYDKYKE